MAQLLFACSHMHSYDECMSGEERDEDRSMSDTHLKSYTYNGSTLERSNVTSIMTYTHKGQMSPLCGCACVGWVKEMEELKICREEKFSYDFFF